MSENESKRMKDDTSSESLLPENVIAILNNGIAEGFEDDILGLGSSNINDSMIPELCEWIIKLGDKVKEFYLGGNQITSVGASMLFDTLKKNNSSMKGMYLDGNKDIDDKCMKSLGEYIKSNKSIDTIRLYSTSISDASTEILAPYLDGNTTFKQLDVSGNKGITDKSIPSLMKIIESSCIENVDIYDTSITQINIIYVLLACNRIKNGYAYLDLSGKELNDDDLIKICDAMKKYGIDELKELNLGVNYITSKGASMLLSTLKECKSVVSNLNLSANKLDDECMKQLGEYLQDNEYVKILNIGNFIYSSVGHNITDKGIEILSEYLIGNTALNELGLHDNHGITGASVPHLIEMINKSCISKISLWNTSMFNEKQREIDKALSIPIEEREIPIKSNTKSAAKIQTSFASAST